MHRHLVWQVQRQNMAYYCHDGNRSRWIRYQCYHAQHRRALHLLLPLRFRFVVPSIIPVLLDNSTVRNSTNTAWFRRLFGQLSDFGLGVRDARPDHGEKGCVTVHRQCGFHG